MEVVISVIIPTHNRVGMLARAIQSVLKQTFQDFEIIVVNDASVDGTVAYLQQLQKQESRIRMITNEKSVGGAESRNKGIAVSRGKWIAFLDDDDIWLPQKLAKQLQLLSNQPLAIACSCAYNVNYPLGIKKEVILPKEVSYARLLQTNLLGGASVCVCSTSVLKQIQGFDKRLRSSQDWDLWVRLREQGDIITVNEPLVEYQVHFSPRITSDMRAKYLGARRFYFKYKPRMDGKAKLANLSFICFIQSRQRFRSLRVRWKKLMMAIKYSSRPVGMRYMLSSLPRMLLN